MNTVILLAGGCGSRVGAAIPKQYLTINGTAIIEYTLDCFSLVNQIDSIIIVANAETPPGINERLIRHPKVAKVVPGGCNRIESVRNGFNSLTSLDDDKIIISDAVRPCVSEKEINELLLALDKNDAATTFLPSYETIYSADDLYIKNRLGREGLIRQTAPEGYLFKTLKYLYNDQEKSTIASFKNVGIDFLISNGKKVGKVLSNPFNFKITTKDDIRLFETLVYSGIYSELFR